MPLYNYTPIFTLYIYMYIYIYIRIYMCIYIYVYTWVHSSLLCRDSLSHPLFGIHRQERIVVHLCSITRLITWFLFPDSLLLSFTYVRMYVHLHITISTVTCLYTLLYVLTHIYTYTNIHLHAYIYILHLVFHFCSNIEPRNLTPLSRQSTSASFSRAHNLVSSLCSSLVTCPVMSLLPKKV